MHPEDEPRSGPRRPPRPGGARPEAPQRSAGGPRRPPRPPRAGGSPADVGAIGSSSRPGRAPGPGGAASGGRSPDRRPGGSAPHRGGGVGGPPAGAPARAVADLVAANRGVARPRSGREREIRRNRIVAGLGVLLSFGLLVATCTRITGGDGGGGKERAGRGSGGGSSDGGDGAGGTTTTTEAGLAAPSDDPPFVDPASSGKPWSSKVLGQLTFRGNPTRSYYGLGPVPKAPVIQWQYPETGGMCGSSPVGSEPKTWCGSGWTGEPAVWVEGDRTWVAVGTYDKHIHFWDAKTGENILEPHDMGDIIKGSVTRDPDGFPLLYTGSRANFEILALDRDDGVPQTLWTLHADDVSPTKWNNDWDGSPLVIDDYLFEGGENGQFHIVKLNRAMGADGKVTVDPKIVFHAPGWDDQELSDLAGSGTRVNDVSIENSVAISGDTVYFSNSGGLVQGWDVSKIRDGGDATRTFRFWTGDDTDASVVVDPEGMIYVAQEVERSSSRSRNTEVGQLVKLDPSKPDDPIVWSVSDPNGMWATPALVDGIVIAPTDSGRIIAADQKTGEIVWEKKLPGPTWSSPVVVDDVWVQGDCNGVLHGFDLSNPRVEPPELWSVQLEGCVESTPTVFRGQIFVGARGGKFYALGDKTG